MWSARSDSSITGYSLTRGVPGRRCKVPEDRFARIVKGPKVTVFPCTPGRWRSAILDSVDGSRRKP